jgi:hypothetical protein
MKTTNMTKEQWLASQQVTFAEEIVEELRKLIPDLTTDLTPILLLDAFASAGLDLWFGKDSSIAFNYIVSQKEKNS